MEAINERVREVRKMLKLNQSKFGAGMGMAQSTITMIETGRNAVSDRLIKSICTTYGISEDWLREGRGAMEVDDTADVDAVLRDKLKMTDREIAMLRAYLSIPAEKRAAIIANLGELEKVLSIYND